MDQNAARAKCVQIINEAKFEVKEGKLDALTELKEIILHQHPELLSEFVAELLEFQARRDMRCDPMMRFGRTAVIIHDSNCRLRC